MKLSKKIPARTVMADSCRRAAFRYWLADQEQAYVLIAGPVTLAQAEELLQGRFDDRVVKVEIIRKVSI